MWPWNVIHCLDTIKFLPRFNNAIVYFARVSLPEYVMIVKLLERRFLSFAHLRTCLNCRSPEAQHPHFSQRTVPISRNLRYFSVSICLLQHKYGCLYVIRIYGVLILSDNHRLLLRADTRPRVWVSGWMLKVNTIYEPTGIVDWYLLE